MLRILNELLDWRMQFQEYKTLILTGSTAADRTKVLKEFARKNFENLIWVNLKNNEQIRTYINTMPAGYDAYLYLEKTLIDMIVPLDTMLFLDNAHECEFNAIVDYANNLFEESDMCFFVLSGDFTEEELEKLGETCIIVKLPEA